MNLNVVYWLEKTQYYHDQKNIQHTMQVSDKTVFFYVGALIHDEQTTKISKSVNSPSQNLSKERVGYYF